MYHMGGIRLEKPMKITTKNREKIKEKYLLRSMMEKYLDYVLWY